MHSPADSYAMKAPIILLAVLVLLLVTVDRAAAQTEPALSDEALVQTLREGGFNIYFRHAATDWSQSDEVGKAEDWLSCDSSRMRQLSAEGRQTSSNIGDAIRALGLPVGKVMASPYCRTVETAELMQLGAVEATTDVVNMRVANYFGGRGTIVVSAQTRLSTRPAVGTNTVIVAHGNVAQAATPVYPGEGEAVIFKPDGAGGFRYIARIAPHDWSRIIARVLP
jgi:phosphohistidine phosphatase SixA